MRNTNWQIILASNVKQYDSKPITDDIVIQCDIPILKSEESCVGIVGTLHRDASEGRPREVWVINIEKGKPTLKLRKPK